ncbi:TonB family protein [Methylopila musalis]|uniref:Protein TonB n=1 Tax=Methylopila musalis TaxID=1134781 RepID=A0ABW3ZCF8_9HYPH
MARADALSLQGGPKTGGADVARWVGAGAVILAAHAGVLIFAQRPPQPTGFETPPAIEMDLMPPPSGETQELAASESAAVPESTPDTTDPIEPDAEMLPELETDTPPLDETVETVEAEETPQEVAELPPDVAEVPPDVTPEVALPPEQTVTAREIEEPKPAPVVRKRETPKKPEREPVKREARKPPAVRPPATASTPSSGSMGSSNSAGSARASADYGRRLHALLAAQKRYPAAAQAQRMQGRAVIRFTVNRSGSVVSQSIAQSSGYAVLDQELQAMLRRAAGGFPPMPADMAGGSKTYTVPMSFSFRG